MLYGSSVDRKFSGICSIKFASFKQLLELIQWLNHLPSDWSWSIKRFQVWIPRWFCNLSTWNSAKKNVFVPTVLCYFFFKACYRGMFYPINNPLGSKHKTNKILVPSLYRYTGYELPVFPSQDDIYCKSCQIFPSPFNLFSSKSNVFLSSYRKRKVVENTFSLSPVTRYKIMQQLSSLKVDKSSGLDGIPARFLRDAASVLADPVAHIVNLSITSEVVPSSFKDARVSPLFKKGSKTDPGNYCPVSILKVLERLVHCKLVNCLWLPIRFQKWLF